jgi:hypothetical protein
MPSMAFNFGKRRRSPSPSHQTYRQFHHLVNRAGNPWLWKISKTTRTQQFSRAWMGLGGLPLGVQIRNIWAEWTLNPSLHLAAPWSPGIHRPRVAHSSRGLHFSQGGLQKILSAAAPLPWWSPAWHGRTTALARKLSTKSTWAQWMDW